MSLPESTPERRSSLELLRRYDRPGPRYTSYPTAVEFTREYDAESYRARLSAADERGDAALSLYVHLPFCEERCTYCGCNVVITRRREVAARYLSYLEREIELLAGGLPRRRRVSQLHWGGGTPTYLSAPQMRRLHGALTRRFEIEPAAEVAIEVDPRVTSGEQVELLRELGFNRISMGVQDFSPEVQAAIGRNQTEDQTRSLYLLCRELGFESINFDLIYGLPLQTAERFDRGMDRLISLRPDRIAVYSYAHLPRLKAHQKRIAEESLPDPETKLSLFCIARERLLGAGYAQIGMDHFALPDDELVRAAAERRLGRNFMGYTVKMGRDMLGLGVSAIGEVEASFAQNVKKLSEYYRALEHKRFPIERGYVLSADDRIRRAVIAGLMCNFHVDRGEIERRFAIDFASYFAPELAQLQADDGAVAHGFVELDERRIAVVGDGRLFVRNVCMHFDRHLRDKHAAKQIFSRTI